MKYLDFSDASYNPQGIIVSPHKEISYSWGSRLVENLGYLKYTFNITHFPIFNGAILRSVLRGLNDGTVYQPLQIYLPESVFEWGGHIQIKYGINKSFSAPHRKVMTWLTLNGTAAGSFFLYDPLNYSPISYPSYQIPTEDFLVGLNKIEVCASVANYDATSYFSRLSIEYYGGTNV